MENPSEINSVSKNTEALPKRSGLPIPTKEFVDKQPLSVRIFYIAHENEIKILFQKYSKRPSRIPVRVSVEKIPPIIKVQEPDVITSKIEKSSSPVKKTYSYIAYTINGNGDILNVFPPEMKDSDVFTPDTPESDLNTEPQPAVSTNGSRNGSRKRLGRLWKSLKKIFTCGCCCKTGEEE